MPSLFDGHASTITCFAACALFRVLPVLIELILTLQSAEIKTH